MYVFEAAAGAPLLPVAVPPWQRRNFSNWIPSPRPHAAQSGITAVGPPHTPAPEPTSPGTLAAKATHTRIFCHSLKHKHSLTLSNIPKLLLPQTYKHKWKDLQ